MMNKAPLLATLPAYNCHLVELCAGSAALTLHMLGSSHSIMPYQGSKWAYRRRIAEVLAANGVRGISSATLVEMGEWARTWKVLRDHRPELLLQLEAMATTDPRELYDALKGKPVPGDAVRRAVEHLFLQRVTLYGKAVDVTRDGRWMRQGFSRVHAYGTEATERFGGVRSQVAAMPERIGGLPHLAWVDVLGVDAAHVSPDGFRHLGRRVVVFIDPPYAGTTGYAGGDLTRDQVVRIARIMADAGHTVVICEASPIPMGEGWKHYMVGKAGMSAAPFRSSREEWLTVKR